MVYIKSATLPKTNRKNVLSPCCFENYSKWSPKMVNVTIFPLTQTAEGDVLIFIYFKN